MALPSPFSLYLSLSSSWCSKCPSFPSSASISRTLNSLSAPYTCPYVLMSRSTTYICPQVTMTSVVCPRVPVSPYPYVQSPDRPCIPVPVYLCPLIIIPMLQRPNRARVNVPKLLSSYICSLPTQSTAHLSASLTWSGLKVGCCPASSPAPPTTWPAPPGPHTLLHHLLPPPRPLIKVNGNYFGFIYVFPLPVLSVREIQSSSWPFSP